MLMIAIPCYEACRVEFLRSLVDLEGWLRENNVPYDVKTLSGTLVYYARDSLARQAVNNGFDEVLWIDADMVFDRHLYEDLKMGGKDITCGLFISRHYPYVSCVFSKLHPVERITQIPEDAFRVAGCGFGAVLMKTKVLQDVMNTHRGMCFMPDPLLGEDVAFCKRATDCGYEIWCEPTARVGHVGQVTIWPEDGPRLRGEIQGMEGKELI